MLPPCVVASRAPHPPASYEGPLRFIHNDLCPDHILVDLHTGELTGLIDWTDAALADPALDFVVLATWKGLRFLNAVLEMYPDPADPGRRDRVVFLARVLSLIGLHEAIEQGAGVGNIPDGLRTSSRDRDAALAAVTVLDASVVFQRSTSKPEDQTSFDDL